MRESSKKQIAKINKILDTKFYGYHAPKLLFRHSSDYGTLVVYDNRPAYATGSTPSNTITLEQFFRKYDTKPMNFKDIICRN